MPQNIELEIEMIKKFVDKNKQNRYISFVSSAKNRMKFISYLPHNFPFRYEMFDKVAINDSQLLLEITTRLKLLKATDTNCYIISEDSALDTRKMDLFTIVKKGLLDTDLATILIFGDADLIYFYDEDPSDKYLSKIIR